jgi:protein-S-isoprenylcysteine O-methyltransferase Ste14
MPAFNQNVANPYVSYLTVLLGFYILYVLFAYPIFMKFRPQSVLTSRNVLIVNYIKRQFKRCPLEEKLLTLSPDEDEKQAFVILFVKAFFGSYCLSLLCNKYLVHLGYDFGFLGAMWQQCVYYTQSSGVWAGLMQFLDDTADMWLTLMFTVVNIVFAFSYLTEAEFLKNKIKYADTSFLGITSCIMCYYPFTLLTEKIMPIALKDLVPVENTPLRLSLYFLVIVANFIIMLAVLRLGTKSGNLTNRGIVTGFPYNIVRHPEYSMRIFYIVLTVIPVYIIGELSILGNIILTIGMLLWIFVFVLRSITEERNLIKDENYKNYIQKVKYRFIPFII